MSYPVSNLDIAMNISRIAVLSIGILGNIISFIVFSRKTFRKNSISTYCQALSVFDCLTIIQLVKDIYLMYYSNQVFFENINNSTCRLFYYLSMQYTAIPGWILVAFSIDKMLNMRTSCPNLLKSKLFQWSVVAAIVIVHLLLYSELLISLQLEPLPFLPQIQICNYPFLSYLNIFLYAQLSDTCIVPFLVMFVTTIFTIRLLTKSRNSLHRIGQADKKRRMRDMKFAFSSMAFNVFFIAFKMPFLFSYILPLSFVNNTFFQVSFFLFLINCSANFFIHFATNSIFRREVYAILGLSMASNRVSSLLHSISHTTTLK